MNLQRMIVVPPETFENLKKLVLSDAKLSQLDRNMKKILYSKNLSDTQKWHHYRQNLLKYLKLKKSRDDSIHKSHREYVSSHYKQTKPAKMLKTLVPYERAESTPRKRNEKSEQAYKSVLPTETFRSLLPSEDIINISDTLSDDGEYISIEEHESLDEDSEYGDVAQELALEGQPPHVTIVSERSSLNPEERKFELSTGEQVSVPIADIQKATDASPYKSKLRPRRKGLNNQAKNPYARNSSKPKNKLPILDPSTDPRINQQTGSRFRWQTYK